MIIYSSSEEGTLVSDTIGSINDGHHNVGVGNLTIDIDNATAEGKTADQYIAEVLAKSGGGVKFDNIVYAMHADENGTLNSTLAVLFGANSSIHDVVAPYIASSGSVFLTGCGGTFNPDKLMAIGFVYNAPVFTATFGPVDWYASSLVVGTYLQSDSGLLLRDPNGYILAQHGNGAWVATPPPRH